MPFSCLFQCFEEKEYQTEPNGMKPSGELFLERKQSRRLGVHVRESTRRARGRGRAYPPGRALHPRGPLVAPLTDFLRLYISPYPENIQEHHETLFPPPQPAIPVRSHLGAFPALRRRGNRSRRASTSSPRPLR